jgi:hypothetical protein
MSPRKVVKHTKGKPPVVVSTDWPYWRGGTKREWRRLKRQELLALERALVRFNQGCAFTPEYRDVATLERVVRAMRQSMAYRAWR